MRKPLSDKAKGKQRAVEPIPIPPSTRPLVIRFNDGIPDLSLRLGQNDTLRQLKANIRAERPQLERRRLKLIHAGRLITNDIRIFEWLTSFEDRQRRAEAAQAAATPIVAPLPIAYFHCSVGPELEPGETEDSDEGQTTQIKPLRGFDRLAGAGFSDADITNFRRQFHAGAGADALALTEFATEEEYEEHARTLEEQWIENLDGASLGGRTPDSTTILQGILVGFFFPLIPFFVFASPRLPVFWSSGAAVEPLGSVVFSKRMQMGIVLGFLVNILLGLWRYLWGSL
ncbi:hypothetical protein K488DRAFT_49163 [Vararia minispora EC-137]|uniref:Uncharacterized protein n=1 Tax=Vararia minispora EC-137 TaxID=1314806 RepID=A0ACB8QLT3_9AGAM|nr:hypothetical protein K488DRAFT_49163 [Vararia minispora EC-137]